MGKRSFGSFEGRKFEVGSGSGSSKKPTYEKAPTQDQGSSKGQGSDKHGLGAKGKCDRCLGPHTPQECKWKLGACFTCGQVGHRVAECKNPILRNVFCFHSTQRGHLYSKCPERKNNHNGRNGNGKPGPRVFALRYEEAPTIDTFASTFSIASLSAYALVDTGAAHSCMSEERRMLLCV